MNNSEGLALICATRNRTVEVRRLLESLQAQTNKNFELIVVDQNEQPLIDSMVAEFASSFSIIHLKQHDSNNSKARNLGSVNATYHWLGFPDDDCWYPNNFVEKVLLVINQKCDGLFINWTDPEHKPEKIRFQFQQGLMNSEEAFTLASCICLFVNATAFAKMKGFNEKLGLGETTLIKAGEEQDLTLRLLAAGFSIYKHPEIVVHHAMREREWDNVFKDRIVSQGACDFLFTKRFKSSFTAYWLLLTWSAGVFYNILRFRKRNYQWYLLKLKGGLTAPRIYA
jgi:glycosyltransferase involved in cell wall biosynthesis